MIERAHDRADASNRASLRTNCTLYLLQIVRVYAHACITRLSVSYGAYEAVVGEMNGLHGTRGLVISEGHQGGVINHFRESRCWRVPRKRNKQKYISVYNIRCIHRDVKKTKN